MNSTHPFYPILIPSPPYVKKKKLHMDGGSRVLREEVLDFVFKGQSQQKVGKVMKFQVWGF